MCITRDTSSLNLGEGSAYLGAKTPLEEVLGKAAAAAGKVREELFQGSPVRQHRSIRWVGSFVRFPNPCCWKLSIHLAQVTWGSPPVTFWVFF